MDTINVIEMEELVPVPMTADMKNSYFRPSFEKWLEKSGYPAGGRNLPMLYEKFLGLLRTEAR